MNSLGLFLPVAQGRIGLRHALKDTLGTSTAATKQHLAVQSWFSENPAVPLTTTISCTTRLRTRWFPVAADEHRDNSVDTPAQMFAKRCDWGEYA